MKIPIDINDAPAEFFSAEVNVQDGLAYLTWLADETHKETGVPPIVFGIGGQGGSAISFDRLLFKAMARTRTDRREIEGPLPEQLDAVGAPPGRYVYDVVGCRSVCKRGGTGVDGARGFAGWHH